MDVSIIIVNYNTKELLKNCLFSIIEQTKDIDYEIIVSDNASSDGSVEIIKKEFPQVLLIENKENLGFGKANNKGLEIAKGKYIFYLNSDTILLNNAVKIFFDYWENSLFTHEIGALGTNLIGKDRSVVISSANFPSVNNEYKYLIHCLLSSLYLKKIYYFLFKKNSNYKKIIGEVDFIIGADLFLRNDKSAKFDERYFMYYEESDLQLQLANKGLKRILIDGPQIIHLEGGSTKENRQMYDFKKKSSQFYWTSSILYLEKNLSNDQKGIKKLKRLLRFIYSLPMNK